MIKILYESSIFLHQNVGGISKYITSLNDQLINKKINSKIFAPLTINQYLSNKKKNNFYIFKFKRIPKFCRKFFFFINDILTLIYVVITKPDIIHLSYYNNFFVKNLKIPFVITVYDLIHEKMNLNQLQFKKKLLLEKAKHIICISKQTKKDLIKFYKIEKQKISVIYLGIKKTNFKKKIVREKFLLFVGDRGRYKNFQLLVKAFSKSKFLKKKYKIICFGGGIFNANEKTLFKKFGIKNNIIQIKGDDKKLKNLYQKASLYISLSKNEGFGLTLLEAMQYECPVVCSDIPVFREIYKNSCIYVKNKNINSIKKGIENLLKSKKKQKDLVSRGRKIANKFTWKKCALFTTEVYKKVLNNNKSY